MFDKPILWLLRAALRIYFFKSPSDERKIAAGIANRVARRSQTRGNVTSPPRASSAALRHRPADNGEHATQPYLQGGSIEPWFPAYHDNLLEFDTCRSAISPRYLALPHLTRHILYLSQREGMNGAQISVHLGLSRQAVRRHLRRAVAALAAP